MKWVVWHWYQHLMEFPPGSFVTTYPSISLSLSLSLFLTHTHTHTHTHTSLGALWYIVNTRMSSHPLQCSCLENPRDGGAWWAAVSGVAQNWT